MTATTVTPEMLRVAFLRKIAESFCFSLGVRMLIKSALDGISCRWCLAAILSLMRFASSCVGDGSCMRAFMISRAATSVFCMRVQLRFHLELVDKLLWLKIGFLSWKKMFCGALHPVLSRFPLQNYAFLVVSSASVFWARSLFGGCLDFWCLRSDFSCFG